MALPKHPPGPPMTLGHTLKEMLWLAFVFVSERGTPFTVSGFRRMVERAAAGLEIKVHPHMLRHACGFKLANDGVDTRALQAYLGHRNIQHTVRYTELAPGRFKGSGGTRRHNEPSLRVSATNRGIDYRACSWDRSDTVPNAAASQG